MVKGNNYEVTKILVQKINELELDLSSNWFRIDSKVFSKLFEEYQFTKISVPFSIGLKETKQIIKDLKKLNNDFAMDDYNLNKEGYLSNSLMDSIIYPNYEEKISFAPFLYGPISESDVESKRKLIKETIDLYKEQTKIGLL